MNLLLSLLYWYVLLTDNEKYVYIYTTKYKIECSKIYRHNFFTDLTSFDFANSIEFIDFIDSNDSINFINSIDSIDFINSIDSSDFIDFLHLYEIKRNY